MQRLWAKVFAGEISKPGSYSLRTLNALFMLEKSDADLIAHAATFCLNGEIIYYLPSYLNSRGLSFGKLLALEDMGVLSTVSHPIATGIDFKSYKNTVYGKYLNYSDGMGVILDYRSKVLVISGSRPDQFPGVVLEVYLLTDIGRELIRLGDFDIDMEYLSHVKAEIEHRNEKYQYLDVHIEDQISGAPLDDPDHFRIPRERVYLPPT
jgi:Protein of unknown function (DUF2806)